MLVPQASGPRRPSLGHEVTLEQCVTPSFETITIQGQIKLIDMVNWLIGFWC